MISIFLYFKLRLPTIQIDGVKTRFESTKRAARNTARAAKQAAQGSPDDDEFSSVTVATNKKQAEKQSMKSLIKDKLSKSVQSKEDEASLKKLHINFPSDKPTFDINLLEKAAHTGPNIEESRLIDKAEAIKDKLAEFNIDVSIE